VWRAGGEPVTENADNPIRRGVDEARELRLGGALLQEHESREIQWLSLVSSVRDGEDDLDVEL
jgi:hypothetical protein